MSSQPVVNVMTYERENTKKRRAMAKQLTPYEEAKIVQLSAKDHKSIASIADQFNISYARAREILRKNGIKVTRGRKRGSGKGLRIVGGRKVDRRVAWQTRMIEQGLCTNCSEPNDSESMYHCKKCLKKRTEAKRKNAIKR